MRYVASVSFGKDSLAMLLKLIELKYPLDEVVFYDTGMEFDCIYDIRDKVKKLLSKHNIKYTEFKPQADFEYLMFEKPVNEGRPNEHLGYSWCGGRCRWGTTHKLQTIDKYLKDDYQYIGIACDETPRIEKERKPNKLMPLVEWGMTESDCLEYCHSKGWYWNEDGVELYSILDRVSCWCCANKNLKELKNYYLYLPKYWDELKRLQSKTDRKFKKNYSIFELEDKFKKETGENMTRTKSERKHNTWKKILRKLNILKSKGIHTEDEKEFLEQPHRLAKDKVEERNSKQHTNNKTKRHISGNYQKSRNYSNSDQKKIDAMNYED